MIWYATQPRAPIAFLGCNDNNGTPTGVGTAFDSTRIGGTDSTATGGTGTGTGGTGTGTGGTGTGTGGTGTGGLRI